MTLLQSRDFNGIAEHGSEKNLRELGYQESAENGQAEIGRCKDSRGKVPCAHFAVAEFSQEDRPTNALRPTALVPGI